MVSDEGYTYEFDVSSENERLAGQHQALKLGMGKLVLAPMDLSREGLKILDAGYWLQELGPSLLHHPTCELIGTDITGERFPDKPEGMKLLVQNSVGPFPDSWAQTFDLVHQRFTLSGIPNYKDCVSALLSLVKPGGWIQLVEPEDMSSEPNGPQVKLFADLVKMFALNSGSDLGFQNGGLESALREAGFIRVGNMVAPVCFGAECPDPSLREQSMKAYCHTASQFMDSYKRHRKDDDGLTPAEIDSYVPRLADELRDRGGYAAVRVVWAQRPF
ncbi:uncharacterized protein N7500_007983 [Penicillium coprophilum]|uniref:uncharacterized protein n=1 Tax=Penicillium coprophilum TaxID=36646 RepID=UPI0023A0D2A8|nr:uncharacterized protein N7500_007983 [Penicillium coprophilum]KAJ5158332.1 hypothetical protein N7500_007983 [Penicillium coprophilum]